MKNIRKEDLADGTVLNVFKNMLIHEPSREHLLHFLTILRDSQVILPIFWVMDEEDQKRFMSADVGDIVATKSNISVRPDIVEDEQGRHYLPAFTQDVQIPKEYGKCLHSSTAAMSMMQCVEIASEMKQIEGIVLDAFTSPFIVTLEMMQMLQSMPSRLMNEN